MTVRVTCLVKYERAFHPPEGPRRYGSQPMEQNGPAVLSNSVHGISCAGCTQ